MTAADSKIRSRGKFSEHPPITHKGSIHPAPSQAMLTLKKCALSFQWVCHSAIPHWSSAHGLLRAGLYLSKGAALEWQLAESPEQDDLISKDVCSLCAFLRLLFSQTIRKSHRYCRYPKVRSCYDDLSTLPAPWGPCTFRQLGDNIFFLTVWCRNLAR